MSQKKQTSVTSPRKFTRVFKLEVATRYLRGDGSYRSLSKELGVGKTQIFSWVHTFANEINANPPEAMKMSSAQPKKLENSSCHKKADEVTALTRELEQMRKELAYERMRATAYEHMIEIAENRWNIEIRKKSWRQTVEYLHAHTGLRYTVTELCALFGRSKQAYYKYNSERLSSELARDTFALEFAQSVRQKIPGIGCAKLWRIYEREFNGANPLGRDRFLSLLYENKMKLRHRPRGIRTTDSRHELPLYPDLVKSFIPTAPNQLWVSDITYIPLVQEDGTRAFCYLTTIMDAYSRKVLAHEVGDSLQTRYSLACLKRAIAGLQGNHDGLIHHSDRGVQYASAAYTTELKKAEIDVSMTQTGNPKDNAQAERINSTVKNELLRGMVFHNINQVKEAVGQAFDFYNNRRPHMSIDYMTPEQAHMQSGKIKERWVRYRRKAIEKLAMSEGKKENGNENLMEYDGNWLTLLPHEEALRSSISVQPHAGI